MRILVTGVGALIGYGIIKSLKKSNKHEVTIIGMDIYEDAYGRFLCDKFFKAERADSENYLSFINDIIEKENIDLIIPGIEQDMYMLALLQNEIKVKIVLNNNLLIDLSKDKLKTYLFFKENSINVIPTLFDVEYEKCIDELGSPFLLKPRSSYASKGIYKIHNKEEFNFYNNSNNIFQRIIGTDSEEYTVSVFGNGEGGYVDYIILKRTLAQTGATDKAQVLRYDEAIINYIDKICQITKPIGPTNIQLRKELEEVFLLEINPRISSACSIRTYAGYNEPQMCIDYYLRGIFSIQEEKKEINAVRFIDDFFYE